ncbi:hypothetical protein JRO89_XS03G0207000 [Xanthoceras sorbifolium]|uniref:Transcription repressor n=1 Tax=Xanthoceras sorbifolium TaxID=99658 RepID=A0ABQ8IAW8_9ROSI|nr:hypothetical protein JRO89_XS03G0207000 [Xanthoceras sorbifolium]
MSNIFWKNLHLCFSSALKCPNTTTTTTLSPSPPSDDDHQNQYSSSSPNTTSSLLMIKNFNSLYDFSSEFSTSKDDFLSSTSSSSDTDSDTLSPPDFATIFASQRLFFSSPGRSNSIIESPDSSRLIDSHHQETVSPLDGGVAVKKYSPDPYRDFRCSMQEMIEARNLKDVISDWDFLHELLFCYLTLNPKHTHKFIITAFADILVSLLPSPDSASHRQHKGHRR